MGEAKKELDHRLARGELSIDEYNKLIETIRHKRNEVGSKAKVEHSFSGGGLLFSFLIMLIVAGVFAAGSLNVVNTNYGLKLYQKKEFSLKDPYVDLTRTSFVGLRKHPELIQLMVSAGDTRLLPSRNTLIDAAQFGMDVNDAILKFDSEYNVSSSITEMNRIGSEKFEEIDEKYDIRVRADELNDRMKQSSQKLNEWLKKQ